MKMYITRDIDRLFDLAFNTVGFDSLMNPAYSPDTIITEDTIKIDLLGAKKEDISVNIEGNVLSIYATKIGINDKKYEYKKKYEISEKHDPKSISAKYENSILSIKFKTKKENEPIQVKIE